MPYTVQEAYDLAAAAQRVESAAFARTLTNNPSAALETALEDAVADFQAIVTANEG